MSFLPDEPSIKDIEDKLKSVEEAAAKSYFTAKETSCRCGCKLDIKPEMLDKINEIRKEFGKPISLTCGARCEKHNKSVGGAAKSAHLEGIAVDMVRSEELLTYLKANLEKYDLYMEHPDSTPSWLHIQTRKAVNRIFKP